MRNGRQAYETDAEVLADGLSIDACRALLSASSTLTDAEVLRLRNQLYSLANVFVSLMPGPSQWELIEERAAILEFEAKKPRHVAELDAMISHVRRQR